MLKCLCSAFVVALAATVALSVDTDPAQAQAAPPGLPGAPQPTPGYPGGSRLPQGPQGGSGNYAVSAAANEHAAFLWVVDNVQRAVVLCEKPDGRDFTCTKKPLP